MPSAQAWWLCLIAAGRAGTAGPVSALGVGLRAVWLSGRLIWAVFGPAVADLGLFAAPGAAFVGKPASN